MQVVADHDEVDLAHSVARDEALRPALCDKICAPKARAPSNDKKKKKKRKTKPKAAAAAAATASSL